MYAANAPHTSNTLTRTHAQRRTHVRDGRARVRRFPHTHTHITPTGDPDILCSIMRGSGLHIATACAIAVLLVLDPASAGPSKPVRVNLHARWASSRFWPLLETRCAAVRVSFATVAPTQ